MRPRNPADSAIGLQDLIATFMRDPSRNTLRDPFSEPAFQMPLLGFARGDDPLFDDLKTHVGPFHWTPEEVFRLTFPNAAFSAAELTVISWVLPQTKATKADNRRQTHFPAERWAQARTFGEEVNEHLRRYVVDELAKQGYGTVAPVLSPQWSRETSPQFGYASRWSERHIAFVAGLGTFGLSDGLITPRGKAMRVGSVVTTLPIEPSPRPYTDHHAYCLFYTHGTCGKCIQRCPAGAISEAGHDKVHCKRYIRQEAMPYVKATYGFEGKGCGLCQTKIPCESKIPLPPNGEAD